VALRQVVLDSFHALHSTEKSESANVRCATPFGR